MILRALEGVTTPVDPPVASGPVGRPTDPSPPRNACAVKLDVFEGPLDLLLHLIQQNDLDIENIPIAALAEQYLAYLELMRMVDIDVAAEYLLMAATLAHIKSRMLLPPADDEDADGEDPRAELARRLAEYATFQEVSRTLADRPLLGRDVFAGSADRRELPEKERELEVSLFALLDALRRVLDSAPPEFHPHEISLETMTLQDRMMFVMDAIAAEPAAAIELQHLLSDPPLSRMRVVVTFLAILELARMQALRIFQNSGEDGRPYGPVRVRAAVADGVRSELRAEGVPDVDPT